MHIIKSLKSGWFLQLMPGSGIWLHKAWKLEWMSAAWRKSQRTQEMLQYHGSWCHKSQCFVEKQTPIAPRWKMMQKSWTLHRSFKDIYTNLFCLYFLFLYLQQWSMIKPISKKVQKSFNTYIYIKKKLVSDRKALCYGLMAAFFFLRGT